MRTSLQLLKKHWIALIMLVFYTLLCIRLVVLGHQLSARLKAHPEMSGLAAGGELLGHASVFLFFVGGIFFLTTCGYAIGKPKDTKFYSWLIVIIVVETIITLNIHQ